MRATELPVPAAARQDEYAVAWRAPDGVVARGSLTLTGPVLALRGLDLDGRIVRRRIPLAEIDSVRIGRTADERVQGMRCAVLALRDGGPVAIAPLGAGELVELAELVAELSAGEPAAGRRIAIVLPLRDGTAERARELVSGGPPFDLHDTGLERHHVFVTDREVVFLFEGAGAREKLDRVVRSAHVLRAAARWRECLAGPPRIAEESFAWRRDPV